MPAAPTAGICWKQTARIRHRAPRARNPDSETSCVGPPVFSGAVPSIGTNISGLSNGACSQLHPRIGEGEEELHQGVLRILQRVRP